MHGSREFGAQSQVFISRLPNPALLTDFLNYLLLMSSLLGCACALCNFQIMFTYDRECFRVVAMAKAKVRSPIILTFMLCQKTE